MADLNPQKAPQDDGPNDWVRVPLEATNNPQRNAAAADDGGPNDWVSSPITPEIQPPEKEVIHRAINAEIDKILNDQPNASLAETGQPVIAPEKGQLHPTPYKSAYDPKDDWTTNLGHAILAGAQSASDVMIARSFIGLITGGTGRPSMMEPEDLPGGYRIASMLTNAVVDAPVSLVGSILGGLAGASTGVLATAPTMSPAIQAIAGLAAGSAGAGAGAAGLPASLRTALLEHYDRGDYQSWNDFWESVSAGVIDGVKNGAIGALGFGVGGIVGNRLAKTTLPILSNAAFKPAAKVASEIVTMVTAGKALEGTVPKKLSDFADTAALVFILHGAGAAPGIAGEITRKLPVFKGSIPDILENTANKLKMIYEKTGLPPAEVAQHAAEDPVLVQELLADGQAMPTRYGPFQPPPIRPEDTWYHGTAGDFQHFDLENVGKVFTTSVKNKGFWFTKDPEAAGEYAKEAGLASRPEANARVNQETLDKINSVWDQYPDQTPEHESLRKEAFKKLNLETDIKEWQEAHGAQIMPVHLDLRNPKIIDIPSYMKANGIEDESPHLWEKLIADARADGHDGIIFKNTQNRPGWSTQTPVSDVAVAFDPGQIRFKHLLEDGGTFPDNSEKNAVILPPDVPQNVVTEPADVEYKKGMLVRTKTGMKGVVTRVWPDGKIQVENEKSGTTSYYMPEQLRPRIMPAEAGGAEPPTPPPSEPPDDSKPPRSNEEISRAIQSKIGPKPPDALTLAAVGDKAESGFKNLYERVVDKYFHVADAVGKMTNALNLAKGELSAAHDPYKLLRLAVDFIGKGEHFIKYGTFDFDTLKNHEDGIPLAKILKRYENDRQGFTNYLIAKRHLELAERVDDEGKPAPIKSGFPITDKEARQLVESGVEKYEEGAQQLHDYSNRLLDYLVKSGRVSEDQAASIKKVNQAYIPLYRITEEGDQIGTGRKGAASKLLKNIFGVDPKSATRTVDPIESIVRNTFEYIRIAELNRAWGTFLDMDEAAGTGFSKKVKTQMRPIQVSSEEMAREMNRQLGLSPDEKIDPDMLEAFNIFRPMTKNLKDNEIGVWREGKMEVYEVDPGIARAFKAADNNAKAASRALRLVALPAKALRGTLGLTPDFIVRNFVRDQITAGQFSKYADLPIFESLSAMKTLFKDKDTSEDYQNWLKSGGTSGNFVSVDRDYITRNVWELNKKTGFMSSAWNVVHSPLEFMKVGAEIVENSTRLAEFKRVTKGDYSLESLQTGGFASREVTVDFQRTGANTQAWNMITAFWNANVQGMDRAARAFIDNPVETGLRTGLSITLPSLLLWSQNHQDPRWQEIPRWEKDLFWIFMTKDHIYRVPKPFEVGVLFGSLFERTAEAYLTDNPHAKEDFIESLIQVGLPGIVPTFAIPFLEQWANKSTFTGHSIVNQRLQGIGSQYQYMPYTTEVAKIMGNVIGHTWLGGIGPQGAKLASPQVVENYVRAWSGNFGMYALQLADRALVTEGQALKDFKRQGIIDQTTLDKFAFPNTNRAETPWGQSPFFKAFEIQYPSMSAQSIQDFYQYYTDFKQYNETIKHLQDTADVVNLRKEISDPANQKFQFMDLEQPKNVLGRLISLSKFIEDASNMTPHEKRQQLDEIYAGAIKIARTYVDKYEQGLKIIKERQGAK